MTQRRFHYEKAFEYYLRANKIPYVAVDEAKKSLISNGNASRMGVCAILMIIVHTPILEALA